MHPISLETARPIPVLRDILVVFLATFVICLSGQLAIPLWFTPIPIALQNSVILTTALFLGPRRALAAVFLFLLQGLFGLPVFSNGHSGIPYFCGPTGGYLIGYLVSSWIVGITLEKRGSPILAFLAGTCTIYLLGAAYLATFLGLKKALLLGVAPFILGDLLKAIVGLKLFTTSQR
jgi:biotin transport system substrate-specific component